MIGNTLEFSDLQRISGYTRRADVERWAERIGLPVKPCRGGVWTTEDALNQALGIRPAANDGDPYSPDIIGQ